jgi:hypothetical protein
VTYESLKDTKFIEVAKKAFPSLENILDESIAVKEQGIEMRLINIILKAYERWQDRRRFGKLEPLDHYCVRRVLENGDEIKYMMRYDPQTTKRVQQSTNKSEK